jgi:outer membrane protein TolC
MSKLKFISVLVLLSSAAQAQTAIDNELKSLIQKSFTYFPRVKELEQQVEVSTIREDVTRAGYRPTITGSVTYSYIDPISIINIPTGPGTFNEIKTQPNGNQNAVVSVNQLLYDFGRAKHNIEKSKYDILIAKDNLELNKSILASQVSSVYFGIIYLQKSITVQDSVISYYRQFKKLIDNRIKQGDALEFDALSAQNNIDQAENRKVDLTNTLHKQFNLLAYSTGEASIKATSASLDFQSETFNEDSLISIAKQNNRELLISKNRILQQEEDLAINRANLYPTLSLNGSVGVRNGYQPDINQNRFNYLIGAGLSIPIYTGKRNSNQIKISQTNLLGAHFATDGQVATLNRDINQALTDIKSSNERLKNSESQITQTKRALELAKSRFTNGTITYVELINAQTNLQQANLFKLQYEYQRTLAKVELTRLTGVVYW